FIDDKIFNELNGVLAAWEEAKELDRRLARIEKEREEAHAKQSRISEQLGVLKDGGPAAALRLRYVRELEAGRGKVNRCEKETRALGDAGESAKARGDDQLRRLTASV